MKKLLMGSIVIFLFAISIMLVQVSCSKSTAQPNNAVAQINKIIYGQYGGPDHGVYIANYDGTGQTLINITLPTGFATSNQHPPVLSPDGTKIVFVAYQITNNSKRSIFTCDVNGSNLVRIVDCPNASEVQLGGAY